MKKDVLAAGLLGGVVMLVWLFVTNAALPFKSNLMHKVIPLAVVQPVFVPNGKAGRLIVVPSPLFPLGLPSSCC